MSTNVEIQKPVAFMEIGPLRIEHNGLGVKCYALFNGIYSCKK